MKFLPPSLEASGKGSWLGPLWRWVVFMVLIGQGLLPLFASARLWWNMFRPNSQLRALTPTPTPAPNCPHLGLDLKGGVWCARWLTLSQPSPSPPCLSPFTFLVSLACGLLACGCSEPRPWRLPSSAPTCEPHLFVPFPRLTLSSFIWILKLLSLSLVFLLAPSTAARKRP